MIRALLAALLLAGCALATEHDPPCEPPPELDCSLCLPLCTGCPDWCPECFCEGES